MDDQRPRSGGDEESPTGEQRQVVRFLFAALDESWRRLPAEVQLVQKEDFAATVREFRATLLLRTYSLMGTRGDADLLFWQAAPNLEALQAFETAIYSTQLGAYLRTAHSLLSMTRRSTYAFPDHPDDESRLVIRPADYNYLYVYPFVKSRAWYALPQEERQDLMSEHVRIGRKYPGVRVNTTYSFGLDDQEFVVTFENDDPGEFLDLVMDLRASRSSQFTERDTPVFTCLQMSIWDALDSLGGARASQARRTTDQEGYISVARCREIPEGFGKRVYLGQDAVAVFNVGGTFYAVDDRCSHGRASLSEGRVDPTSCTLTCPWHDGRFDLRTGKRVSGPPRASIRTYGVRVEDDMVRVRERTPVVRPTEAEPSVIGEDAGT